MTLDKRGQPSFVIVNTDARMIDWLRDHVWVDRESVSVKQGNPSHKPRRAWRCPSRQVAPLLQALLPFLICKKERAEILIAVDATINRVWPSGQKGRGGPRLSPSVLEFRAAMVTRIHELNRRGVQSNEADMRGVKPIGVE